MIGIIDYGMGNLASVRNALEFIGQNCNLVADPDELRGYDRLILPGVGAFGQAMVRLNDSGMTESLREFAASNRPLLGICLGQQLLLDSSEEQGQHNGLGLISGQVLSLKRAHEKIRIPHIGWAYVDAHKPSRLMDGLSKKERCFYFVHGYYCHANDKAVAVGQLNYGVQCHVVVEKNNVFGTQFHPEKSQAAGLHVLRRFAQI